MDGIGEAIDRVAEKLGVAAWQLVPYFDQYSQMKASVCFIAVIACSVVLAVCIVVLIIDFILWLRNYDCDWLLVISLVVGGLDAFTLFLFYLQYYKWTNFPDAMLLDTVISNIAH